jgi:hypothetical protein
MNLRPYMRCTIGITAFTEAEKQALIGEIEKRMPDPVLYRGHGWFRCFDFGSEYILVEKYEDEMIDIVLTGDMGRCKYAL